jgi:hypothetical protein
MQNYMSENIILEKFKVVFIKLQGLKHNKTNIEGIFHKSARPQGIFQNFIINFLREKA